MYTQHSKQIFSTSASVSIFKRFTIVFVVAAAFLFTASNAFAEALSYNNLTSYYNPVWYMGLNDAQGSMSVVNTGSNTSQGAATDVTFGTQGIIGTAATFNGGSSKITIADNNVWNSEQATVEGWVKASDIDNNLINIFGYRNNAGSGYCRTLNTNSNGNIVFYEYASTGLTATSTASLAADEWVYVAATVARTGTNGTKRTYTSNLYINGALAATATAKDVNNAVLWNDGNLWVIGNSDLKSPSGTLKTFAGSMDELATYNTALSQSVALSKYMVATNQVSEKSLMANATLTASSTYDNTTRFVVDRIKDGILYDISGKGDGAQDFCRGYWIAQNGVNNASITVDLGSVYNIDKIDLQNCRNAGYGDSGTKDFTLYYSTDGNNWTHLLSNTLTASTAKDSTEIMPIESFTFTPVDARYVKFEANSYVFSRAGLSEMWVFEHTNYWGVGTDLSKDWTIDGTDKTGAKFTDVNGNTGAYLASHAGSIALNSNAEFEVTGSRIFTQSGSVYGSGGLNKTGDGTLILFDTQYSGDTTVSGGTLLVKSNYLSSQNISVLSGGTFQSADVLDNASVNVNGGSLILGTDSASIGVYVTDFTLSNGGIVNFDMNTYDDHLYGFDFLEINNSGSLNSGFFNLTFNSNEDLWQEEAQTNGGYELLTYRGSEGFAFSDMGVLVNNDATTDWLLQRVDNDDSSVSIWLVKNEAQDDLYWFADKEEDIARESWTIDHNPKLGVRFTEGSDTASYGGSISMTEDGSYKVGSEKNLTLSGVISGAGAMEKTGAGTLTLSNANTYSGGTTIAEGTLKLSGNGTLGSGAVEIQSGSTLELADSKVGLINVPSLTGSGAISVTSTSFLALASTDPQAYYGTISVDENKNLHIGFNNGADRAADVSLPNATVSLASGSNLGLVHESNSAKVSTFTIGTLNGVAGSVVRTSGSNGGADNYSTLTVGQGSFAGVIGGNGGNQAKLNLIKNTDGTLTLSGANTFTGNVDITGGTLIMSYNAKTGGTTDTATALGNPSIASRRITVHSGATLLTNNGGGGIDVFGGAEAHPAFRIVADGGMIATATDNLTSYGDLEFKNGGVFEERGGHSSWFTIFNGDVYVTSGDATIRSTSGGRGISLRGYRNGTNPGVTFDVAKNSTLTLSALLKDSPNSKTVGSFTKTGEGTMILNNGGSTYTGNITINEGNVKVTAGWNGSNASPLGGVTSGKTVTVNNGGELIFNAQDAFINAHSESNFKFVVDGGKISNEGGVYNYLTNTTFRNGGQLYASDGNATWKAYKLHNVKVERNLDDSVGAPVTFSADMSKPNATIVFGAKSDTIKAGTSKSTITVEEITSEDKLINDHVSDLVISAVIADPTYQTSGALKNATEIIKAGAGTMELTAVNTYTGPTTVSGGTLLLSSSGRLASPNVTVGESAAFQTGANIGSTNVTLNGGSFIIGENAASASITAASLTMTDGAIYFDFNGYTAAANDYDQLLATSATLTSGIVNLTFNSGDETSWWNNATDSGYVLINANSMGVDLNSVQLYVGNAVTDSWYLTMTDNNLVLMKLDGPEPPEPPVTEPYYYANTADISADKWTIDGVNKKGVKFLEGDSAATYANPVELNMNGLFDIAAN
ncbi:MAG: autotransporter-associated beta strand repeat-containing protein, partial [Thermoguttaceae bacterium]|nr:autotransporter-associated beta strand repeat-containing protein [Thermoguttaceae bacterium]